MNRVLNVVKADSSDQDNTFMFAYVGMRGQEIKAAGYLFFSEKENQFYIMKKVACIQDTYTAKDIEDRRVLSSMPPVRDGDKVEVGGKVYAVKIRGNYSDAGRLVAVV